MLFVLIIFLGILTVICFVILLDSFNSKFIVPTIILAVLTFICGGVFKIINDHTLYFENITYNSQEVDINSFNETNTTVYQLTVNDGTQNITKYYTLDIDFSAVDDTFKKVIFSDEVTEPIIYGYIPNLNKLGKILNVCTFKSSRYEIILPKGTISFSQAKLLK